MVWVSVGGGFDSLHSLTHGLQWPLRAVECQLAQNFLEEMINKFQSSHHSHIL